MKLRTSIFLALSAAAFSSTVAASPFSIHCSGLPKKSSVEFKHYKIYGQKNGAITIASKVVEPKNSAFKLPELVLKANKSSYSEKWGDIFHADLVASSGGAVSSDSYSVKTRVSVSPTFPEIEIQQASISSDGNLINVFNYVFKKEQCRVKGL